MNTHEESMRLMGEEDFLLPLEECGINQTIRELRLRSQTGVTIVSIYRGDESFFEPAVDVRLLPGDVLLIRGDEEQVRAGMKYLKSKAYGIIA